MIPVIHGLIDRRILVNYRVDPDVLASLLPAPFRPKLMHGFAIAGICLIRLSHVRPACLPSWMGIASENAAHRAAVEWDDNGAVRSGVYVWRRDTDSRFNSLVGGRLFPGIHHHAAFAVHESADHFDVQLRSRDRLSSVSVEARRADHLATSSIFSTLEEISCFFQSGSLGYSSTPDPLRFEALELRCHEWHVEPLDITHVRSSFFDEPALFPTGSISLDSALLMRGMPHDWHSHADLCCTRESDSNHRVHSVTGQPLGN